LLASILLDTPQSFFVYDRKGVFMQNEKILWRLGHFAKKKALQATQQLQAKFFKHKNHEIRPEDIQIDNYSYESHRIDDLPLTITKDPGPGVKYTYTENSEFARGAEKEAAFGIDSFGEKDTYDFEEADDYQDFRNRKQNSDLSKRYYTGGLDNQDDFH
jgi:hypothetical protein